MFDRLKKYIEDNDLFTKEDHLLISVSGGMDSMFLLHVLSHMEYRLGVAHINHKLRGRASDEDSWLVESRCKELGIPFYLKELNWNSEEEFSQKEARDRRYTFLKEIKHNQRYDYVLTAHHKDDVFETYLINSFRGRGVKSLTGILNVNQHIRRPLLCFARTEIEDFMSRNDIVYREDKSNQNNAYARNRIRNVILPEFEILFPNYRKGMEKTIDNIRGVSALLENLKLSIYSKFSNPIQNGVSISKEAFIDHPSSSTFLHLLFGHLGFNSTQLQQLSTNFNKSSGEFHSDSHCLYNKKDRIDVVNKQVSGADVFILIDNLGSYELPNGKEISLSESSTFEKTKASNIEYIALNGIEYPLQLRKWQAGDIFYPSGMKGQKKKVKKLLADLKLNGQEKSNIWILLHKDQIVWICGLRLDNRYLILSDQPPYLKLEYQ